MDINILKITSVILDPPFLALALEPKPIFDDFLLILITDVSLSASNFKCLASSINFCETTRCLIN